MLHRLKYQFKKGFAWLLALIFILSVLTGCGSLVVSLETGAAEQTVTKLPEAGTAAGDFKADGAETQQSEETGAEAQREQQQTDAQTPETAGTLEKADETGGGQLAEDGSYTSKDEVAEYLHIYGRLPDNYITKKDAEALGWDSKKGNLWDVAPGKSIGGSRFGNYEGLLPDEKGRKYFECDIDYDGSYRGAKRIIYSNDGLIFYTEDHYKSFEQLY